ncbi:MULTISPECIES: hydrolase [unclassified Halomonas]|uniref:hydrolase n=1 Tax=unclassified Halomonas TaxID=2609666 RepID=UPI0021BC1619|nr:MULTISPECIES: hydrolase [unclassified Halomonas]
MPQPTADPASINADGSASLVPSRFRAARWLSNPHVQTLLPRLLRPQRVEWRQEFFTLPDGDEVELAWVTPEPADVQAPLFVLFHGLEGGMGSPYAHDLLAAARDQGYRPLLMHFRGCGSRPNRLPRAYHSGDTGDARVLLDSLSRRFPGAPKVVAGVSLGGNMLLRLLAEPECDALGLHAALVISAPLDLAACAQRLGEGFSRVYERHLLGSLKRKVLPRLERGELPLVATAEQVRKLKRLRDYDDLITAPLHGFRDAEDYYTRASSGPVLDRIQVPTLLLHAKDDPFMPADLIDRFPQRSPMVTMELAEQGGHVGFMAPGDGYRPDYWLGKRLERYLQELSLT